MAWYLERGVTMGQGKRTTCGECHGMLNRFGRCVDCGWSYSASRTDQTNLVIDDE